MAQPGKHKHYWMKDIRKRHFLEMTVPLGLQSEMEK